MKEKAKEVDWERRDHVNRKKTVWNSSKCHGKRKEIRRKEKGKGGQWNQGEKEGVKGMKR